MAQQVRMTKYSEFNPEPSKWRHNKRNLDQATEALDVMVAKNYSKLALPCVAIYPDVDRHGECVGFKVAAPEGPLKSYFEQDDTKLIFFNLIQDACIDAMAKKEKKRAGEEVGASVDVLKALSLTKPPRPVWTLTLKELETFVSILKGELAKKDGIKLKRKWPKIVKGETIILPTKVPSYDEVAEKILPSSQYVPFQKFSPGNLVWRLKLVIAYFFTKYNLDPNEYATNIPDDFQPRVFSIDELIDCSTDVNKSAEKYEKKKSKKKPTEAEQHVPFYLVDDVDYDNLSFSDSEENETDDRPEQLFVDEQTDQEIRPTAKTQPTAVRKQPTTAETQSTSSRALPASARTLPITAWTQLPTVRTEPTKVRTTPSLPISVSIQRPRDLFYDINEKDDILNMSRTTGTPENSVDENDEGEQIMAQLEEELNEEEHLSLMENTDIRNVLTGDRSNEPILQVYSFQKLSKQKCYKAHAHDGQRATTKITFCSNLNEKLENLKEKLPIIKLTKFVLYNDSFLFIEDFEVLKVLQKRVGNPEYLTENEYAYLKQNMRPNRNLPQTPTMVTKKMTTKYVNQVNLKPDRSMSQRLKNRSHGSNT